MDEDVEKRLSSIGGFCCVGDLGLKKRLCMDRRVLLPVVQVWVSCGSVVFFDKPEDRKFLNAPRNSNPKLSCPSALKRNPEPFGGLSGLSMWRVSEN